MGAGAFHVEHAEGYDGTGGGQGWALGTRARLRTWQSHLVVRLAASVALEGIVARCPVGGSSRKATVCQKVAGQEGGTSDSEGG